ncbi:CesD/SycD/LcrH family type III secretion system chaperone [Shewanella sp. VB17]|uniref:CesD/SycD/LcrH family type III secretion system chaperone n=1 Tax=Shewanella sp. VB17 TaxID=2739432 RepID=UPI001567048F|nr:CesD/SycD/LcrH family type III secretion system chaperone [Shewanella sp. VB17]NRD74523.1 CesD/SycD/LcrH family type III secretion system chaperone [Shewanella sp. VB17]
MKKHEITPNIDIEQLQAACQLALVEQKTLAELAGLSSQDLERVYDSGLGKYQAGLPAEAIVDFTYLVMHQPWDRRFHLALASSFQWLGECRHALIFYGYALAMDACDPSTSFRIGQCLLSLDGEAAAIEALQMAIKQSYSKPEYHGVGVQAQALLEMINHS